MKLANLTGETIKLEGYDIKNIRFECEKLDTHKQKALCVYKTFEDIFKKKFDGIILPERIDTEILSYILLILHPKSLFFTIPDDFKVYIYKAGELEILPIEKKTLRTREWSLPIELRKKYVVFSENTKNLYVFDGADILDIFGRLMYMGETGIEDPVLFFTIHPDTNLPACIQSFARKYSVILASPEKLKYPLFPEGSGLKYVYSGIEPDLEELKKKYKAKEVYKIKSRELISYFTELGGMTFTDARRQIESMKNLDKIYEILYNNSLTRFKNMRTYIPDVESFKDFVKGIKPEPKKMEEFILELIKTEQL